jgi:hypothetical protein
MLDHSRGQAKERLTLVDSRVRNLNAADLIVGDGTASGLMQVPVVRDHR